MNETEKTVKLAAMSDAQLSAMGGLFQFGDAVLSGRLSADDLAEVLDVCISCEEAAAELLDVLDRAVSATRVVLVNKEPADE